MATKAAVYVRYSSENQRDGYSVEYQTEECAKYIEAEGWAFSKAYVDEAVSGRSASKRAAFFELLADVKRGLYDVVVVYKFSRFARNLLEATIYRQQIEKAGARLVSAMERIDDQTPEGRMMRNIILSMDEYYSDNLSTFVQSSMHVAAKAGKYLGGIPPFGYRVEGGEYAIEEREAGLVRKAFSMRASGMLPAEILRSFREEGITSRNGKPFTQQLLNKIFRAEKYIGVYEYEVKGYEPVRIEGGMPRIVDQETWEAVQVQVDLNASKGRGRPKGRAGKNVYPLTGLIFCSECGEPFTGNSKGNGLFYYTCRGQSKLSKCDCGSISKKELEDYAFGKVRDLLLDPAKAEAIADAALEHLEEAGASGALAEEIGKLEKERADLSRKMEALVDMRLEGKIPADLLDRKAGEIGERLEACESALRAKRFAAESSVTREGILSFLAETMEKAGDADDRVKKAIASQFVDRIEVGRRDVLVRLKADPVPSGDKLNGGWALFTLSPKRKKNRSGWTGIEA